ncbi:MAG: sulfatase/phosphatase domain-containing protein, partial [Solirubrobacteraceae bacterium]
GPGVPHGSSTDAMSENVDLAETFSAIGGTTVPGDGHSLLGLLHGASSAGWRNGVLVEHHGPATSRLDPDEQNHASGNPTTYEALRAPNFLYVEYLDGEREYYDLRTDPWELHNLAGQLGPVRRAVLHAELGRLERCHGTAACWADAHLPDVAPPTSP